MVCCSFPLSIIGIILILLGIHNFSTREKVRNIPTSKIRSAAVGSVELIGKAKGVEEMFSPISKIRCAYWRIEWFSSTSDSYVRIYSTSSKPFYLEDETGKILVDPTDAKTDIKYALYSTGYINDDKRDLLGNPMKLDQKALDYLQNNPEVMKKLRPYVSRLFRITEFVILDGMPLYVLGNAESIEGVSKVVQSENLIVREVKRNLTVTVGGTEITNTMFIYNTSDEKKVMEKHRGGLIFIGAGIITIILAIILFVIFLL